MSNQASVQVTDTRTTAAPFLKIVTETIDLVLPNGTKQSGLKRDFLATKGAVAVLIISTTHRCVFLVRQYRHPVYAATKDINEAFILEAIAGHLDGNESPKQAVVREIKEEAGFDVAIEDISHQLTVHSSPGITNEQIHLHLALIAGLPEQTSTGLEAENEHTDGKWFSFDEIAEMFSDEKIKDLKTALLLCLARIVV